MRKREKAQKLLLGQDLSEEVKKAAMHIRQGGLVAFPTETVYGLGGDALNKKSVENIYKAKGRPGDNPLIVHIACTCDFYKLALEPPPYAKELIECFWPGPFTLVVRKNPELPKWFGVHPDLESKTVGIRMPSNPVALSFIKESGCFIAAPSANIAGRPSSTSPKHIITDFPHHKDLGIYVLDGGASTLGLESTVVDITGDKPVILRPGSVTPCQIEGVVGEVGKQLMQNDAPRSPGMKYKHYAPNAPVTLIDGTNENIALFLSKKANEEHMGAIVFSETFEHLPESTKENGVFFATKSDTYAKNLYENLRAFDSVKVATIYAQTMPTAGIGAAVMDRLYKASEGRIINV